MPPPLAHVHEEGVEDDADSQGHGQNGGQEQPLFEACQRLLGKLRARGGRVDVEPLGKDGSDLLSDDFLVGTVFKHQVDGRDVSPAREIPLGQGERQDHYPTLIESGSPASRQQADDPRRLQQRTSRPRRHQLHFIAEASADCLGKTALQQNAFPSLKNSPSCSS